MSGFNTNGFIFNENLNVPFLEELFDGDTLYAETVFQEFLESLPAYWNDVESAYTNKNLPALQASVHKCKTLFGYVGATSLQELCQEFEDQCKQVSVTIASVESDYRKLLLRKENTAQLISEELNRLQAFNNRN